MTLGTTTAFGVFGTAVAEAVGGTAVGGDSVAVGGTGVT
jgi:hypothetical protein